MVGTEVLKAVMMAGADVNTDLNTPGLGSAYSYYPVYNNIAMGGGVDRHGGVGLLNTYESVMIGMPGNRLSQDNRQFIPFEEALAGTSSAIQTYQQYVDPTSEPLWMGYDYGAMYPVGDFEGIWYKHYYYFRPPEPGYLRIVLTWNRPYNCTLTDPVSCGPDFKPDLNMLLRDLNNPTGAVGYSATYDPNEEVIVAPVTDGDVYRLDIYKQNYWPGPESFGLAVDFTLNPQ